MKNLVKHTNQELDTCNALVVMPESEQTYENYTQNSEDTKAKGGLYKVEQKVVKKKKHKVRIELPENIMFRVLATLVTFMLAFVVPDITANVLGITEAIVNPSTSGTDTSEVNIADMPIKPAMDGIQSLKSFESILAHRIIPITMFIMSGLMFISLVASIVKIEDAGEEEKVKEEISEFQVPYPDEFYKQQITTEENSEQGTKDKTATVKSSMLFVPFPDEIAKKEVV